MGDGRVGCRVAKFLLLLSRVQGIPPPLMHSSGFKRTLAFNSELDLIPVRSPRTLSQTCKLSAVHELAQSFQCSRGLTLSVDGL